MAAKRPEDVNRVMRELEAVVNETARLQIAADGTEPPPLHPDRRRNERRGIEGDRRTEDRRDARGADS